MAKKYRRRRYKRRKTTASKMRAIAKKVVGQTRETKKLVSFVMDRLIRSLNTEILGLGNTPWQNTLIYSLTGGRIQNPNTNIQDPDVNTVPSLFALRPASTDAISSHVNLGGDGGIVDSTANTTQSSYSTQGVHQLQGRECYLKNFYANIRINNQGHQAFEIPGDTPVTVPAVDPEYPVAQYIRLMIVQTRRPLGAGRPGGTYVSLARQLLLQFHAGDGTGVQVAGVPPPVDINADSVIGFLNLQVIKKVLMDKLIWLGDGDKGTAKTQWVKKVRVRINKKAYWNYQYNMQSPIQEQTLSYQGPFYYLVAFTSNKLSQNLAVAPRINMSSILTFYDE